MFSSWVFAHGHLRPCLFCKCYLEEGSWPVMLAISPTTEQNGTHAETFEASHTPNFLFERLCYARHFGHGPLKRLNPPLSVFPPIAHECALVLRLPWLRAMTTYPSWRNDFPRPQGCALDVPSRGIGSIFNEKKSSEPEITGKEIAPQRRDNSSIWSTYGLIKFYL